MPRIKTDYSKTIIYVIKCKDDNITEEYIGSTTDFIKRKCAHKSSCNNEKNKHYNFKIYKFIRENGGWINWIMLEVEKYPCQDKNEAHKREEEIRIDRKAKLNMKKAFGAETKEEYNKNYYEENKEYYKKYYEENIDKIKEQKIKYYEENKEEIKEQKIKYREENKEEIKEKIKKWHSENKDKIKEQKIKYREENKEEISNKGKTQKWICPICNKEMREDSKNRHNKTFHQNF